MNFSKEDSENGFSLKMKMKICHFSVPKTLFGLNTVGSSVGEMQGSSELCISEFEEKTLYS